MKKRVYRATKVKRLNLDTLKSTINEQEIILAVDVAKEDFVAVIMSKKMPLYGILFSMLYSSA